jgi:hypothetical protein
MVRLATSHRRQRRRSRQHAALDTVARVAAWKLGLDGSDPTGTTTLTEGVKDGNFAYGSPVTCKTISGHRDANSTACPGLIYDKLPAIRTTADQWTKPADLTSTSVTGATKVNSTSYTKGTVTLGWRPAALSVRTGTVSSTKIPVNLPIGGADRQTHHDVRQALRLRRWPLRGHRRHAGVRRPLPAGPVDAGLEHQHPPHRQNQGRRNLRPPHDRPRRPRLHGLSEQEDRSPQTGPAPGPGPRLRICDLSSYGASCRG